jgi:hypothetical protein
MGLMYVLFKFKLLENLYIYIWHEIFIKRLRPLCQIIKYLLLTICHHRNMGLRGRINTIIDSKMRRRWLMKNYSSLTHFTTNVILWFYLELCNPYYCRRDKSIKLINDANAAGKKSLRCSSKRWVDEDPNKEDIHTIGTVARILRVLKCLMVTQTVILKVKPLKLTLLLQRGSLSYCKY